MTNPSNSQPEALFPIYTPGEQPDHWDEKAAIFIDFVIRNAKIDVRSFEGLDRLKKVLDRDPWSDWSVATAYQEQAGISDFSAVNATARKRLGFVFSLVRSDDFRKECEPGLSTTEAGRELLAFVDDVRRTMPCEETENNLSKYPKYQRVEDGQLTKFVFASMAFTSWLLITLAYALLTPWILVSSAALIDSLLPDGGASIRDMIDDLATGDTALWHSLYAGWHMFAVWSFAVVCVVRIVRHPFVREFGRAVRDNVSTWTSAWIRAHFSKRQRGLIRSGVFGGTIGLSAALVVFAVVASKGQPSRPTFEEEVHRFDAVDIKRPEPIAAAGLRLSSGQWVSGTATISRSAAGEYVVRFKSDEDHKGRE